MLMVIWYADTQDYLRKGVSLIRSARHRRSKARVRFLLMHDGGANRTAGRGRACHRFINPDSARRRANVLVTVPERI